MGEGTKSTNTLILHLSLINNPTLYTDSIITTQTQNDTMHSLLTNLLFDRFKILLCSLLSTSDVHLLINSLRTPAAARSPAA